MKYKPSVELTDKEYPFLLTTGRQLFQYHTGGMTRRVKPINTVSPEAYIEINPEDAKRLAIENGKEVKVSSRRGSIMVKARVSKWPGSGGGLYPLPFQRSGGQCT